MSIIIVVVGISGISIIIDYYKHYFLASNHGKCGLANANIPTQL
jgi:hypothetical protein